MIERVANIGKPSPLVGVFSEPESLDPSRPAVLLLNSGVVHHVGACRLSVKLARRIASEAGLLTLRFDFSGVGDSEPRRTSATVAETAVSEIVEVMDHLGATRGIERFILYGLCSGAHNSVRAAAVDPRVVGIIQIDGYCFPTPKSYAKAYLPKLASPGVLRRLPGRFVRAAIGGAPKPSEVEIAGIDKRFFEVAEFGEDPTQEEITGQLQKIVARGTQLLSIFTGNQLTYNYEGQYLDCYREVPFGDLLTLRYFPDADHIITQPAHQTEIVRVIADWVAAHSQ
jgi:pimeloyl-ACP methyl ester carboxylesterase